MLHLALKESIDDAFAHALTEPVELCRDALLVRLVNGVALEVRFAGAEEYAFTWRCGDAELRIDTAPLHAALATFPHHLHDAGGKLRPDRITNPGADPWLNVRSVIAALLDEPLLESQA